MNSVQSSPSLAIPAAILGVILAAVIGLVIFFIVKKQKKRMQYKRPVSNKATRPVAAKVTSDRLTAGMPIPTGRRAGDSKNGSVTVFSESRVKTPTVERSVSDFVK